MQYEVRTRDELSILELSILAVWRFGKEHQEHQHILCIVYCAKCQKKNQCSEDYTGETERRLSERVLGPNGRDAKSHP